jgi:hypothetical protein
MCKVPSFVDSQIFVKGKVPSTYTRICMPGGAPHVPMFPWKYFFSIKGERRKENQKRLFQQNSNISNSNPNSLYSRTCLN